MIPAPRPQAVGLFADSCAIRRSGLAAFWRSGSRSSVCRALQDTLHQLQSAVQFAPVFAVKCVPDSDQQPGVFRLEHFRKQSEFFLGLRTESPICC